MTITRVGSNAKYASGWDLAFGRAQSSKKSASVASKSIKGKAKGSSASAKKAAKSTSVKVEGKATGKKKAAPKKTATKKAKSK